MVQRKNKSNKQKVKKIGRVLRGRGAYNEAGITKALDNISLKAGPSIGRKALRFGGSVVGGLAGAPVGLGQLGASAGHWAGDRAATLLGLGAYSIRRNNISSRMAMSAAGVPYMHSSSESVRFCKRELVSEIISSATANTFSNQTFNLNPGLLLSFPYLSQIASNFQEYEFQGLAVDFESTSSIAIASTTNIGLGTIMLSTQYRASIAPFVDERSMLDNAGANSARVSEHCLHLIECDPQENPNKILYVRSAAVPSGEDIKTYDLGVVNCASTGVAGTSQPLGKLWASYDVILRKPTLNPTADLQYLHIWSSSSIAAANPWGTAWAILGNTLSAVITATTITFPIGSMNGNYVFQLNWGVTSSAGTTVASYFGTSSSAGVVPLNAGGSAAGSNLNSSGITSGVMVGAAGGRFASSSTFFNVVPTPGVAPVFTVSAGTLGNVTYSDLYMYQLPNTSY
jgi:hypothetical protein